MNELIQAIRELTDLSQAKHMQVLAWEAAVFGVLITLTQLILGVIRQNREDRRQRAKFGYELLDRLFTDEWSSEFLYGLDSPRPMNVRGAGRKKHHGVTTTVSGVAAECHEIFIAKSKKLADASTDLYQRLDGLLYFLDRFEHAISAKLTSFEVVRTPTDYYVRLLTPVKPELIDYMKDVGYTRVVKFLNRFVEWRKATATSLEAAGNADRNEQASGAT